MVRWRTRRAGSSSRCATGRNGPQRAAISAISGSGGPQRRTRRWGLTAGRGGADSVPACLMLGQGGFGGGASGGRAGPHAARLRVAAYCFARPLLQLGLLRGLIAAGLITGSYCSWAYCGVLLQLGLLRGLIAAGLIAGRQVVDVQGRTELQLACMDLVTPGAFL